LTWYLIAPSLQPKSQGNTEVVEEQSPALSPYDQLLADIKAGSPEVGIIRLESTGNQVSDLDLLYSITADTTLTGIDAALAEANTVVGVNLSITNSNATSAFSLEDLTIVSGAAAYEPIAAITTNQALTTFTANYKIDHLTDVKAGDTLAGWLFFELPKSALDDLTLAYTRDNRLAAYDPYTAEIVLIKK
jgi:hypothetical protein